MLATFKTMASNCHVELIGTLRAHVDGRIVDRFQTQRTAALLGFLALNPGRSYRRQVVANMLWPGADETAVRNRLNQAVSSLRRQLHTPEAGEDSVLIANHQVVMLSEVGVTVDLKEFFKAFRSAEEVKDKKERLALMEQACAYGPGPVLEGFNDDFARQARSEFAGSYSQALEYVIQCYSRIGEPERAAAFALKRLQMDQRDELNHLALIDLYLRADQIHNARFQMEELLSMLYVNRRDPSSAVEAMRRRIEKESRVATPKTTRAAKAEYSQPMIAVTTEPIPPVPIKFTPKLARYLTPFITPQPAWDQLEAAYERGSRLITLLGLTGTGKTRLANEWAWHHAETFGGRILWVNAMDAPNLATDVRHWLIEHGGDHGKPLIIIDSWSPDLTDSAADIAVIASEFPHVTILVTALASLDVPGEVFVSVQPWGVQGASEDGDLKHLAQIPAIRLFVERTQAYRPDFQITVRTQSAIVGLCRQLDGIPLALELAAGWARLMTPSQVLEKVLERADFLESRRRETDPARLSMRLAFEAALSELDEPTKRLFLDLSVIRGEINSGIAQAISEHPSVEEGLACLVDRMFMNAELSAVPPRYTLLETLRSYARSHLSTEQELEIRYRHAEFVLANLKAVPCRTHLNQALDYLIEVGRWEDSMLVMAALARECERVGKIQDAILVLERFRSAEPEFGSLTRARFFAIRSRLLWLAGEFREALHLSALATDLFHSGASPAEALDVTMITVGELHRRKEFEKSRQLLDEALRDVIARGDLVGESRLRIALGNWAVERHDYEEGAAEYQRAFDLANAAQNDERRAAACVNLGNLAVLREQYQLAEKALNDARSHAERSQVKWMIAMVHLVRARLLDATGSPNLAYGEILRGLETTSEEALVRWRLIKRGGVVLEHLGQTALATQVLSWVCKEGELNRLTVSSLEYQPALESIDRLRRGDSSPSFEENWLIGELMTGQDVIDLMFQASPNLEGRPV